jgi:uncharacterized membrane protein
LLEGEIIGFGVEVQRPLLNLNALVYSVWRSSYQSERMAEKVNDSKILNIAIQLSREYQQAHKK